MKSSTGPRLIIVCGLPGAGKTTHAQELESSLGAIRLCADDWMADLGFNLRDEALRARIEGLQWSVARTLLAHGLTVAIEWGTWSRGERDQLRTEARALGAAVELHYLSAPADVLFERIRRRDMERPPILRSDLERWVGLFQVPSAHEMELYDPRSHLD